MLRPFPGKYLPEAQAIFNYQLSRARRIIENSFGISAARWRLFRRPIIAGPERVVVVYIKAVIALYNYLRTTESSVYCPPGFTDGEDGAGNVIQGSWRSDDEPVSGLQTLGQVSGNRYSTDYQYELLIFKCFRYSRSTADMRDSYMKYFNSSVGEVSWQYDHVRRT